MMLRFIQVTTPVIVSARCFVRPAMELKSIFSRQTRERALRIGRQNPPIQY